MSVLFKSMKFLPDPAYDLLKYFGVKKAVGQFPDVSVEDLRELIEDSISGPDPWYKASWGKLKQRKVGRSNPPWNPLVLFSLSASYLSHLVFAFQQGKSGKHSNVSRLEGIAGKIAGEFLHASPPYMTEEIK